MTERDLLNDLRILASQRGGRLFRNNTGIGWAGKMITHSGGTVVLGDARPLHAGLCIGSSDLVGWFPRTITADDIGKTVAVFTAVEAKTGRLRLTAEQATFLESVDRSGGIAVCARSTDDLLQKIAPA